VGDLIVVDGGMVSLSVVSKAGPDVKARVVDPGLILSRANLTFQRDGHIVRARNAMLPVLSSKVRRETILVAQLVFRHHWTWTELRAFRFECKGLFDHAAAQVACISRHSHICSMMLQGGWRCPATASGCHKAALASGRVLPAERVLHRFGSIFYNSSVRPAGLAGHRLRHF